jgi:hypothetical protein
MNKSLICLAISFMFQVFAKRLRRRRTALQWWVACLQRVFVADGPKKTPVVPPADVPPADIPPKVEAVLEMEDLPVPVLPLLVWISGLSTHYSLSELSNDATSILCNSLSKFICFVITFIPRKTVPIIGTLVFTSTVLSQKTIAEINTFINQTMANKYIFPIKKQKQSQHQVLKNPA